MNRMKTIVWMCFFVMVCAGTSFAQKSVAVLNLKSDKISATDCIAVTNYMTTEMRKVPGFRIIAWDDVTKMLEHESGKQALGCDDEKCIAEIGGALGVDYIVAGDIGALGTRFICNLKLIDITKAGTRNTVSEMVSGDVGAIVDLLPGMVSRLLSITDVVGGVRVVQGGHSDPATVTEGVSGEQARSVAVTGTRNFVVKLSSNPDGAVAFLNGVLLCQSTPCSKAIAQGSHKLRIVKEMYRDYNAEITVNRNGQEVMAPLVPTFGFLDIRSDPSGIDVSVNGKPAGKTPLTGFKLPEGGAEVSLGNDCYYRKVVAVNIVSGQTRSINQPLQAREGIVDLRAVDAESGDDIIAAVLVNGRAIGETPFLGKVPVCVQEVVVKSDEYGEDKVPLRLAEGQKFAATAKFEKRGQSKDGMVWIEGGKFRMGSNDGSSDEKPVHQVMVSGFYMDKTEVTQAEYERVMGKNPSKFKNCPDCPVETVSWNDAKAYCEKVGKRLPTEAEWEYAARAGTTTKYYWGNSMDGEYAWFHGNSGKKTHPVGQKKPNAWGLYDMSGNVWEWCSDRYDGNYYKSSPGKDPQGATSDGSRVLRGGSWFVLDYFLRSAFRFRFLPFFRNYFRGFRCVRSRY